MIHLVTRGSLILRVAFLVLCLWTADIRSKIGNSLDENTINYTLDILVSKIIYVLLCKSAVLDP